MKYFILFNCFFISSLVFSQINSNHQLIFEYDLSGNQQKREYKNTTIILGDLTEEIQSINNLFEKSLKIYPNPSYGLFYVEWDNKLSTYLMNIEIVSIQGLMLNPIFDVTIGKLEVDLTLYNKGIYYIRFFFTDSSYLSKKIIKL